MRTHVLDANALWRYLTKTAGGDKVRDLFDEATAANTPVLMSVVTFGEVYYTASRQLGLTKAEKLLDEVLEEIPLGLVDVRKQDAVRAAQLKARYDVPYADSFVAALAGGEHVVVTADYEHFQRIPKLRVLKLPSAKKA
jgi:predicted nucleic acid-binding protein